VAGVLLAVLIIGGLVVFADGDDDATDTDTDVVAETFAPATTTTTEVPTTTTTPPTTTAPRNSTDAPADCSPSTEHAAALTIRNDRASRVEIGWYSFECELEPYATLAPGQSMVQDTFVGHVWSATAAEGEELGRHTVAADDDTWVIGR
jgi:hypothetical protein